MILGFWFSTYFGNDEGTFDLCIRNDVWESIKPAPCTYRDNRDVLKQGEWTDVIADEYQDQYHMQCAFIFKNNHVQEINPQKPFLTIIGECKSGKCNNKFLGVGCLETSKWYRCVDQGQKQGYKRSTP